MMQVHVIFSNTLQIAKIEENFVKISLENEETKVRINVNVCYIEFSSLVLAAK